MIKKIAWDTFKNTGDINTFLEIRKLQDVEKKMKEDTNKYDYNVEAEKDGYNKINWNSITGE